MAKPINTVQLKRPTQEELEKLQLERLLSDIAANEDGIRKLLSITKQLNDMGGLDAVDHLLKSRTEVGHIFVDQVQQPATKNLILLLQTIAGIGASVDRSATEDLLQAIKTEHEQGATTRAPRRYALKGIFKLVGDPDVWRATAMAFVVLKGIGSMMKK